MNGATLSFMYARVCVCAWFLFLFWRRDGGERREIRLNTSNLNHSMLWNFWIYQSFVTMHRLQHKMVPKCFGRLEVYAHYKLISNRNDIIDDFVRDRIAHKIVKNDNHAVCAVLILLKLNLTHTHAYTHVSTNQLHVKLIFFINSTSEAENNTKFDCKIH